MFLRKLNLSKTNSFFLFGARGTGKTTLLEREFERESSITINLLENEIFSRLQADPDALIDIVEKAQKDWCIIDEVQKVPELLDVVHILIERFKQKFVLTGSSARKLKRGAANMLAGRAFVFKLFPLTHLELSEYFDLESALSYGLLPKIFSFSSAREKKLYLKSYAETYLKEEIMIEQLIRKLPPFRKFLEIAARHDTEIISYSNIARDILVDPKIVSNYYSILEDTLLGFFLEPFHYSIRKRQKKSPKFYWFDVGVRRALSGTLDSEVTHRSFEFGSLFESFIINEIYKLLTYSENSFSLSFLRVEEDLEIDLILERPGLPTYLIEIKSTDKVHDVHTKNLKTLGGSIKNSQAVVLSRDKIDRVINGVHCLEWKRGFKEMGIA